MKKLLFIFYFILLFISFCFAETNKFITEEGDSLMLIGEVAVPTSITVSKITAADAAGLRFEDDGGNLGFFIKDGGRVGIGTDSPVTQLDIIGTATLQLRIADTTADSTAKFGYITTRHYTNSEEDVVMFSGFGGGANNTLNLGGGSSSLNSCTELKFYTASDRTTLTGSVRMLIDTDGNVGVGTTNPSVKLEVAGVIKSSGVYAVNSDGLKLFASGAGLFVRDYGNVGIGTTEPLDPLVVFSAVTHAKIVVRSTGTYNAYVTVDAGENQEALIDFLNNGTRAWIYGNYGISGTNAFNIRTGTFANAEFVVLQNGNIGFSESAPETLLEFTAPEPYITLHNSTAEDTEGGRESRIIFKGEQSGSEETTLAKIQASHDGTGDDQKGDLIFYTNEGADGNSPTEQARIDSSGNVGIGTTSPTSTLHLNGTFSAMPSSTQTLWSTDTVTADSFYIMVVSSGGIVDIANITAGVDGDVIKIRGTSNTNIINFVEGGNIILGGGVDFAAGNKDKIFFTYQDSYWEEDARKDNNG